MQSDGSGSLRRVVITGLGAITPVGNDKDSFFASLVAGKSGVSRITHFDPEEYPSQIAAEVKNFNYSPVIDAKKARHLDRFTQFAVMASYEAINDAKLKITDNNADRIGVIVGSGIGGLKTLEDQHNVLMEKGPRRINPFLVPM